jgi:hypothetical protein
MILISKNYIFYFISSLLRYIEGFIDNFILQTINNFGSILFAINIYLQIININVIMKKADKLIFFLLNYLFSNCIVS